MIALLKSSHRKKGSTASLQGLSGLQGKIASIEELLPSTCSIKTLTVLTSLTEHISHSGTKFRSVALLNSFETTKTTKSLERMLNLILRMGLYSPLFGHVEKGERFSPINEALFQR